MPKRLWLLAIFPCALYAQTVSTAASNSSWGSASDVAVDQNGNLFVVDYDKHAIYKVTPQGASTVFAGTVGQGGYAGDGGPATSAKLANPTAVAIDSNRNVYIADNYNHRIRQVNPGGIITTFAGTGENSFGGDGGSATSAALSYPNDVAVDSFGNVVIADSNNYRIRRVTPDGTITTIAGIGYRGSTGDGGPALLASFRPTRMNVLADGSIYLSDGENYRVRRIGSDGIISTIAGTGANQNSGTGQATAASLTPDGIVVDRSGNLYIATFYGNTVRRVAPNGVITTFAGTGSSASSGDQGPATAATFNRPNGLAIDLQGNLLIADYGNAKIRRVMLTNSGSGSPFGSNNPPANFSAGTISTAAGDATWGYVASVAVDANGNMYVADTYYHVVYRSTPQGQWVIVAGTRGNSGFSGDGGPATQAKLNGPTGVAVDSNGVLYIADNSNHRIRAVSPGGTITTYAGNGSSDFKGDGQAAIAASFSYPYDVAVDSQGNLLIVDSNNNRIRKVNTAGIITTIAGTGTRGFSGDGGPATVAASQPSRLMTRSDGSLYFTDNANQRVRRISRDGIITTIAGTGNNQNNGDGGASTKASINGPDGIAIDAAGNIYVASAYGNLVRRIAPSGIITTFAGTGNGNYSGDQGPATSATLNRPLGLNVDQQGNLLIADYYNARVRKVLLDPGTAPGLPYGTNASPITFPVGTISSAAGNSTWGQVSDVAVDLNGNMYVPDQYLHVIYRITPLGDSAVVAGIPGNSGSSGDGGSAVLAKLNTPTSVAVDGNGVLYIADYNNHRIRSVSPGGTITTFAGNGNRDFTGDGKAASIAAVSFPYDVALDGQGNLLIVDSGNYRIRNVNASGIITTVAGTGTRGFSGDGGPATVAAIQPGRLAPVPDGSLYFTDNGNNRVRRISPAGIITTIAGTGDNQTNGDGGQARLAAISSPEGIAVDSGGNIYVSSFNNNVIRRIAPDGIITTFAGTGSGGYSGDQSQATAALFNRPAGMDVDPQGNLLIADFYNARIRKILLATASIPGLPFGTNTPATTYPAGTISSAAGNSTWGYASDVAVERSGNIFVADPYYHVIYKTTPQGNTTVVAGTYGSYGSSGDGGSATLAKLNSPTSVAVSASGVLYIADNGNNKIRAVNSSGTISTFAGTGSGDFSGDAKAATTAALSSPYDVVLDSQNNLLIVDSRNYRIRKVNSAGVITTIAGTGNRNFSGDGGLATAAAIQPGRLASMLDGSVYFTDSGNNRVRRIGADGVITTIAGTGDNQTNGDGGQAKLAAISSPEGIAVDSGGNIYVSSFNNNVVRRIAPDGIITTFAGTGSGGYSGDQGPAIAATLNRPAGLDIDLQGNLLVADYGNARVRKVLLSQSVGPTPPILLLVNPPSLTFTAPAGSTDLLFGSVDVDTSVPVATNFEVLVPLGNPWLHVDPAVGTTPATIHFTVDPSSIKATTQTTVTLRAGTGTFAIPLRVNIGPSANFNFQVIPPSVSIRATNTGIYNQQSVPVKNVSSQPGTVVGRVLGNAPWLSLSPAQIDLPPGATGQFSVTLKPDALDPQIAAGFVQANLAFRGAADAPSVPDQNLAVVVSITGETVPVPVIVPQKLTLFTQLGAPSAWFTQFYVGNAGSSPVDWRLTPSDTAVVVAPTQRLNLPPSTKLEAVQVQVTDLVRKFASLGPHQTPISLRFGNPGNEYMLDLQVDIEVVASNLTLPLRVFPAGLFASYPAGGPASFNDALTVTNWTIRPRTFRVSTDASWLRVPGADITVPAASTSNSISTPPFVTIPIGLNVDSLPSGGVRGSITISETGVDNQLVEVLFLSSSPQNSVNFVSRVNSRDASTPCASDKLYGVMTSFGQQFKATVGIAQAIEVDLIDACGSLVTDGSVTALFSDGETTMTLTPVGDGRWSTAWTPTATGSQITITVLASKGSVSGSFSVTGDINPVQQ